MKNRYKLYDPELDKLIFITADNLMDALLIVRQEKKNKKTKPQE